MTQRKPFHLKEVDLSYCLACRWRAFAPRVRYDFCRYDGRPCEQNDEDDFVFTCKHFETIPYNRIDAIIYSVTTKNF